ncbi:MAG: patatin-like phospholipase family protein [Acetobacteraceae bacterium]|nr:patatin-like phospholipase family protein [Acetobacteraceae bacterium]
MTFMQNVPPRGAKPVALVMQGGGALGAYEWGAVTRLCDEGYYPVAVAGVSIGAINAAAIAGARGGDVAASLKMLWERLINRDVLDLMPWFAPFGNRAMYLPRSGMDFLTFPWWTAYCDVMPLRRTLEEVCDFDRINARHPMGFAVTATEVATGALRRFLNKGPAWKARPDRITPDHVLASGALPPGFPMAQVNGTAHWDGGLFDNTPVRPMLDLLDEDQADHVPIVQINLFPDGEEVRLPRNMLEVSARKMELTFQNRFWDDYATKAYDGKVGLRKYAAMIRKLSAEVPLDSPLRKDEQFQTLLKRRCLGNLHVVTSEHQPMTGGLDFSERGVRARCEKGYEAMRAYRLDHKVEARRHQNGVATDDMALSVSEATVA